MQQFHVVVKENLTLNVGFCMRVYVCRSVKVWQELQIKVDELLEA